MDEVDCPALELFGGWGTGSRRGSLGHCYCGDLGQITAMG